MFHGDNLPFLRGINSGTVDLIATDPPFNKGRDFHATPDSLAAGAKFEDRWRWIEDVQPEWIAAIERDWEPVAWTIEAARKSSGEDMAAFLCWLGVRVIEMHRILAPTGSIYLHCDHTASHYIKAMLDSVFGRKNFRNEIVWAYTGPSNTKRWFPRKHDVILFYTKSDDWTFNWADVRVPYVKLETGKTSGIFKQAATLDEAGKVAESWWADFSPVGRRANERTGYPTQKPLALYERIIRASSNAGDVVLDPFAGCATTPIAAERLGRQWIAMDLWEGAHKMITDRLASIGLLTADDERRDQRLSTIGEVHYQPDPPVRTDDGEETAPVLWTPSKRQPEAWERLRPREIKELLFAAQRSPDDPKRAVCAGCGEAQRAMNLQVDHRMPKAVRGANAITNCVLLCAGCNIAKSHRYTIPGLRTELRKSGDLVDAKAAARADDAAAAMAQRVKEGRV